MTPYISNNKIMNFNINYPDWICFECGSLYGNRPCGISTWHENKCDICNKITSVTEPRDFGHLTIKIKKESNNGMP